VNYPNTHDRKAKAAAPFALVTADAESRTANPTALTQAAFASIVSRPA
jgi:hypothetical protein